MMSGTISKTASRLVIAAVVCTGLALAGCDEHVEVIRDSTIPVLKHQTWAWRPMQARRDARDSGDRPVVSRDVIRRGDSVSVQEDPASEITRRELRVEIERQLNAKGLSQVGDPAAADFLVDYHFAMRGHNVTVQRVYPGAYPGLVCGPYGCWQGWGYGPPDVSYENVRFREGTFVLDVVTNAGRQLAYRAIGQEPAYHAQFSHDQLEDMVHALLKGLKPRG